MNAVSAPTKIETNPIAFSRIECGEDLYGREREQEA
jgi:hypothetical protein